MSQIRRTPIDAVDLHVGRRMDLRRKLVGITQEQLADEIGVTFQQVQKYAYGHNRISASRLWRIAEVLGVAPGYFFEGIQNRLSPLGAADPMQTEEAQRLVLLWRRLDAVAAGLLLAFLERAAGRKLVPGDAG